jgi:hypothetical protein
VQRSWCNNTGGGAEVGQKYRGGAEEVVQRWYRGGTEVVQNRRCRGGAERCRRCRSAGAEQVQAQSKKCRGGTEDEVQRVWCQVVQRC